MTGGLRLAGEVEDQGEQPENQDRRNRRGGFATSPSRARHYGQRADDFDDPQVQDINRQALSAEGLNECGGGSFADQRPEQIGRGDDREYDAEISQGLGRGKGNLGEGGAETQVGHAPLPAVFHDEESGDIARRRRPWTAFQVADRALYFGQA